MICRQEKNLLPRNYAATLSSELVSLTFIILAAGSWLVPNETRAQSSNESEVASPLTTVAATVRQNGYHCDRSDRVIAFIEGLTITSGEKAGKKILITDELFRCRPAPIKQVKTARFRG